jgi:acyl transferase domain-containing protein
VSSPVEWVASVQSMLEAGVDAFVECGPGAALTGMVRRIAPDATVLNVSSAKTLHATLTALAERDWTREAAFAGMSSPGARSGAASSSAASSSAASSGGPGASS